MDTAHETRVTAQFGPRADAYVASAVHAAGEDLLQIEALARARPGNAALDLGCGGGHVAYRIAPHFARVTAYDLAADMLAAVARAARERGLANLDTRQGAAERLPFADTAFDAVFCRYSAHHWSDLPAALGEARRVLRPGGYAVFADVCSPGRPLLDTHLQAIELLRDASHVRDYASGEWLAALERAGFAQLQLTSRRLRLEFASWIARAGTPEVRAQAIRSLQSAAADEVARHFAIETDGSHTVDTLTIVAERR